MLKSINFPAVYERITKPRTDEEVIRDLNARFGGPSFEPRDSASGPLAPPPPDAPWESPAKTIHRQPERARSITPERAAALVRQAECPHTGMWFIIGKSKTAGRMRRRCGGCRLEQTVPDSNVTGSDYRVLVPRGRPKKPAGKPQERKRK